jgi:hypothetical protein
LQWKQPLGDMPTDALAALDRPRPLRPPARVIQHRREAGLVGGEPAVPDDLLAGGHDLDRDRALVRVHPDHHWCAAVVVTFLALAHREPPDCSMTLTARGQRYYQQSIPFFSLSRLAAAGAAHAK